MDAYNLDKPVPYLQYIAENPISAASLMVYTGKYASLSHSMA